MSTSLASGDAEGDAAFPATEQRLGATAGGRPLRGYATSKAGWKLTWPLGLGPLSDRRWNAPGGAPTT